MEYLEFYGPPHPHKYDISWQKKSNFTSIWTIFISVYTKLEKLEHINEQNPKS